MDYAGAARSIGPIVDGITHFTGKVDVPPGAKHVIDGIAKIGAGLGPLLMAVSAVTGPGAPFVFAAGVAITAVSGVMAHLFQADGPPQPTIMDGINEGLAKLHVRFDALDARLDSLGADMGRALTLIRDVKNLAIKNLLRSEDDFVVLTAQRYKSLNLMHTHGDEAVLSFLDDVTGDLDTRLALFRGHAASNVRFVLQHRGRAAAALRMHRILQARFESYQILWTHRMLRRDYARIDLIQQHMSQDVNMSTALIQELQLGPWMALNLTAPPASSRRRYVNRSAYLPTFVGASDMAGWDDVQEAKQRRCGRTCAGLYREPQEDCSRDAETFRRYPVPTVVSVDGARLRSMLRCRSSCATAARALQAVARVHPRMALEAEQDLRSIPNDNCRVRVYGRNWAKTFLQGRYTLRRFTSAGARDDGTLAILVQGVGCTATVYEHGNFAGWSVKFPWGMWHARKFQAKGAKPNQVSSLKVERHYAQTCHAQARLALLAMGKRPNTPFPTIPPMPRVKTVCRCMYKCEPAWLNSAYEGLVRIGERENVNCVEQVFKDKSSVCSPLWIYSAWSCRWAYS